eukprot:UC4_evm2s431
MAEKLAREIRSTLESIELSLSNLDTQGVNLLEPLAATNGEPIRISFIVGAGKKARQKFQDSTPKVLSQALSGIGFKEDSGAVVDLACCGSYKFQHNTDTDLKYIHVFPYVLPKKEVDGSGVDAEGEDEISLEPKNLVTVSELDEFVEIVQMKVKSFGQKRVLLSMLKDFSSILRLCDTKFVNGEPLDEEEQDLYDRCVALPEKIEYLKRELEIHMKNLTIDKIEKQVMVSDLADKIDILTSEIEEHRSSLKPKKLARLETQLQEFHARRERLSAANPCQCILVGALELSKCRSDINIIVSREAKMQATVAEMGERRRLEEQLPVLRAALMESNWFLDEGLLEKQLASFSRDFGAKKNNKKKSKPEGAWSTASQSTGKKGGRKSTNAYAALSFDQ